MDDEPQVIAYVALGANLGQPEHQVRAAMDAMEPWSRRPLRRSSLWRTAPVKCPPGSPDFINAVAALVPRPGDTPQVWIGLLQQLERLLGRQPRQVINEARPLDLDLIAWGGETIHTPSLVVPHPRAHLRRFVLGPLSELAPDFVLPGQTRTVIELLQALPEGEPAASNTS